MVSSQSHALALIAVIAGVTALLRFLPFVLFSRRTPKLVLYLGRVLPYAVIAMLVVYCVKDVHPPFRQPRPAGGHFHCAGGGAPPLEAQHPPVHAGGNGVLYAADPAGFYIIDSIVW